MHSVHAVAEAGCSSLWLKLNMVGITNYSPSKRVFREVIVVSLIAFLQPLSEEPHDSFLVWRSERTNMALYNFDFLCPLDQINTPPSFNKIKSFPTDAEQLSLPKDALRKKSKG